MKPWTLIGCISDRFKQEGYQMHSNLEQFLIMEEQDEGDINKVLKFYGSDFEKDKLITQLRLFHANYTSKKRTCIHNAISIVKDMPGKAVIVSSCNLVNLLLVMPATNAISKRSFSTMRCIKTN